MHQRTGMTTLVFILSIFSFARSEAYQFVPTDAEWQSWPAHCQAKYVWTNIGRGSKFANLIGETHKTELAQWENAGIHGVHHYCTGTIYLKRARAEDDPDRRRYTLRNAYNETQYAFSRSDKRSALFAHLATQMATIMYEQDELDAALQMLSDVIVAQPQNGVLYSAMAVMQRKLGRLEEAKTTLLQGNEALDGKSAEISYNLGLISIELGEIDNAVRYAESAYELGFPLPGLRTKLEKLGRM
ncbi:MAG: hypothetical protein WD795_05615 [Woeseia sp.]